MRVLAIGASKNIGYLTCLRLLGEDHTVIYLLRKPELFDKDPEIQKYVQKGTVKVVKGDATVRADVRRAFEVATAGGNLDLVLSSVGGTPSFSLSNGFIIDPPNLCSSSMLNVLASLQEENTRLVPQQKLIAISSYGLTKEGHNTLPFVMKPLFSYALRGPHADKLVMERLLFHSANWVWPEDEPKNTEDFLGKDWQVVSGPSGSLENVVVLRPSLLVDGDNSPAKGVYRASTENLPKAYRISRKEVAHFIAEDLLKNWEKWQGNVVNLSA